MFFLRSCEFLTHQNKRALSNNIIIIFLFEWTSSYMWKEEYTLRIRTGSLRIKLCIFFSQWKRNCKCVQKKNSPQRKENSKYITISKEIKKKKKNRISICNLNWWFCRRSLYTYKHTLFATNLILSLMVKRIRFYILNAMRFFFAFFATHRIGDCMPPTIYEITTNREEGSENSTNVFWMTTAAAWRVSCFFISLLVEVVRHGYSPILKRKNLVCTKVCVISFNTFCLDRIWLCWFVWCLAKGYE